MNAQKDWIRQTNIYEVNVRQYTPEGNFAAFETHLPRLKEMGVETLWFMPITPISKKERKGTLGSYYACSDYVSVNPEFGTLDDFKGLVSKAHAMGFRVIIDWVANHTGWDHVWTNSHPDWYEKENGTFKRASGMDDIIELDFTNPHMRRAMTDAMKFWVRECDIDGFRCDLAFWVELDYWKEAIPEVNTMKPLFWLAEMDPLDHPEYMEVFDAAYCWTWMHRTQEWFQQKLPLSQLISVLDRYQQAPGLTAWFTSNHDENSWNGSEYEKYGEAAKALAVHSCTWPGLPLVYSGQEVANNRRLLFFDKDGIDWNGNSHLTEFYRSLLMLQRRHSALNVASPVFTLYTSSEANILAYLRQGSAGEVAVVLNLSPNQVRFDIRSTWVEDEFVELFTGRPNNFSTERSFEMLPWSFLVFVKGT